jgi:hypothetical protein
VRYALIALAACAGARRPSPSRTGTPLPCELREYTVTSVGAYVEHDGHTKIDVTRLRGAELLVQAQPSLTAEWLHLVLVKHIEAARRAAPSPDCPLDVDDATVTVESSGPGFVVRIRAEDEDDAAEILRRARTLQPR